jgi:hypothetical protein
MTTQARYLVMEPRLVKGDQARLVDERTAVEMCWHGSYVMIVHEKACAVIHPGETDPDDEDVIAPPRVLSADPELIETVAAFVKTILDFDAIEAG